MNAVLRITRARERVELSSLLGVLSGAWREYRKARALGNDGADGDVMSEHVDGPTNNEQP